MKKITLLVLFLLSTAVFTAFAASYMDNEYQKLAREYTALSEKAFDEGRYDDAVKYSLLAEENAELSEIYIAEMLAKYQANTRITYAKNRIAYAKDILADFYYPMAFELGTKYLENATVAYSVEDWPAATFYAEETLLSLEGIKEIIPLPQYYIVTPWASSKDCYWNISGKSYIYNNPLLWENLYQANKEEMSDPSNPDLIHPAMKMLIPSLTGEFRKGVYSPSVEYDTYGEQGDMATKAKVGVYSYGGSIQQL